MKKVEEEVVKDIYNIGEYVFVTVCQTLTHKDGVVEILTTKESDLLVVLCSFSNQFIEKNVLLEKVWGEVSYYVSRSMDVYITKLRKHFTKDSSIEILNVHVKGFKFIF